MLPYQPAPQATGSTANKISPWINAPDKSPDACIVLVASAKSAAGFSPAATRLGSAPVNFLNAPAVLWSKN